MRYPARTLRRLLGAICAFVLLLPGVAAATPSLADDLDGDDRHDCVTVDGRDTPAPGLCLPASNSIRVSRTDAALPKVTAADLADDYGLELVALMPWARAAVSALETLHTQVVRTTGACRSFPAIEPLASRPPPPHLSL